jgi:hypothetical protein
MKLTATHEFSVFDLFVHEGDHACWPFAPECVEEAINERLTELGDYDSAYEVSYQDLCDSWRVKAFSFGRLYSVEEVKKAFPDELVRHLEQIDREGLKLTGD